MIFPGQVFDSGLFKCRFNYVIRLCVMIYDNAETERIRPAGVSLIPAKFQT